MICKEQTTRFSRTVLSSFENLWVHVLCLFLEKVREKRFLFFFCATSEWKGGRGRAENGAREGRKEVGKKEGVVARVTRGELQSTPEATPSYAGYTDRVKEKYLPRLPEAAPECSPRLRGCFLEELDEVEIVEREEVVGAVTVGRGMVE